MVRLNIATAERTEAAFLQSKFPSLSHLTVYAAGEKVAKLKAQVRHGDLGEEDFSREKAKIVADLQRRTDELAIK